MASSASHPAYIQAHQGVSLTHMWNLIENAAYDKTYTGQKYLTGLIRDFCGFGVKLLDKPGLEAYKSVVIFLEVFGKLNGEFNYFIKSTAIFHFFHKRKVDVITSNFSTFTSAKTPWKESLVAGVVSVSAMLKLSDAVKKALGWLMKKNVIILTDSGLKTFTKVTTILGLTIAIFNVLKLIGTRYVVPKNDLDKYDSNRKYVLITETLMTLLSTSATVLGVFYSSALPPYFIRGMFTIVLGIEIINYGFCIDGEAKHKQALFFTSMQQYMILQEVIDDTKRGHGRPFRRMTKSLLELSLAPGSNRHDSSQRDSEKRSLLGYALTLELYHKYLKLQEESSINAQKIIEIETYMKLPPYQNARACTLDNETGKIFKKKTYELINDFAPFQLHLATGLKKAFGNFSQKSTGIAVFNKYFRSLWVGQDLTSELYYTDNPEYKILLAVINSK